MKKGAILIMFSFLFSALLSGKSSEVDSLLCVIHQTSGEKKINALSEISRYYWLISPDSSMLYADMAVAEAVKDGGNRCFGYAYHCKGNSFNYTGQPDSALANYLKAYNYRSQTTDHNLTAYTLTNAAFVCLDMHNEALAMRYACNALDLTQNFDDPAFKGRVLLLISRIYEGVRDFDKSLEYALKAIKLYTENDLKVGIIQANFYIGQIHNSLMNYGLARDYLLQAYEQGLKYEIGDDSMLEIYNMLGIIYDELEEYSTSINYYEKSKKICIELGDSISLAIAYNNLGFVYNRIGQYDKAIDVYKKSLELRSKTPEHEEYLNTCNNLANTYLKKHDVKSAEKLVGVVVKNLSKIKSIIFIEETFQLLGDIAVMKKDYKRAYEYAKKELQYNDSIYNGEKNRSALEMQIRYETESKEKEIELLKKDNEIGQLEVQRKTIQQRVLTITIIALLFIMLGIVAVIRVIRKKSKLLAIKNTEFEEANEHLKKSEQSLTELNATKDKLFSIIAHDLKNPFSALMGFSELLEKEFDSFSTDEKKEYIGVIAESAQNLYKLLDNILQWSRTQIGTITYTPERFSLNTVIWQEVELLQSTMLKKGIQLNASVAESTEVYADVSTIASVIRNLLTNAIKFSLQGGSISIEASYQADIDMVEVVVIDSGIGISNGDIDKLFMIDATFTTKGTANEPGTGLGLMLCKEFVENNGGKIWAVSRSGKGSAFHFTLPYTE